MNQRRTALPLDAHNHILLAMRIALIAALVLHTVSIDIARAEIPPALVALNVRSSEFPAALEKFVTSPAAEELSLRDAFWLLGGCMGAKSLFGEEQLRGPRPPQYARGCELVLSLALKKANAAGLYHVFALTKEFPKAQSTNLPDPHSTALVLDAVANCVSPFAGWEVREWLSIHDLEVAVKRLKKVRPVPQFPEPRPLDSKLLGKMTPEVSRAVMTFVRLTAPYIEANANSEKAVSLSVAANWIGLSMLYNQDIKTANAAVAEVMRSDREFLCGGIALINFRNEQLPAPEKTRAFLQLLNEKQWEQAAGYLLFHHILEGTMEGAWRRSQLSAELLALLCPDWELAALGGDALRLALQEQNSRVRLPDGFIHWRLFATSPEVIRIDLQWAPSKGLYWRERVARLYLDKPEVPIPLLKRPAPLPPELIREVSAMLEK